jgi:hypothetical protein
MIAGICPHGIIQAGIDETLADEDELREFAVAYRLEKREFLMYEGKCEICHERYVDNCKLVGIEP